MVSLAIDPPPSSHRERPRTAGRRVLLAVLVLAAGAGGFWLGRVTAPGRAEATATPAATAAPTPAATPTPTSTAAPTSTPTSTSTSTATPTGTATPTSTATATSTGTPTSTAAATPAPTTAAPRRLVATLSGPLEDSIARALAPADRALAEQLTQVVNRLLVWDLRISRDGRRGDRLEVLWSPPEAAADGLPPSGEPVVKAMRFASSKLGAVLAAYRWQAEGAPWPRYYRADGTELEPRLVDGPIGDYEQVTSLLRDGRRHKGVDFKAPVGSPVLAPFAGEIVRRNWNFAGNGNCIELRDPKTGRRAIFLHLDVVPREMGVGRRVKKGEVIAASGNSGRSFAPHLHYQLEDAAGRVLDPYDVHRTERRVVPAAQRPAFEAARAGMDASLAM